MAGCCCVASLDPEQYYFIPDNVSAGSDQADAVRRQVIQDQMPVFGSKPFVAAAIFWSYQDYRTPTNYQTGLVDADRNKRGSWFALQEAFSPALIDSVVWSNAAGSQVSADVSLHTRGQVEIPAYTLRGYNLHWTTTPPGGGQAFSSGDVALPVLLPGSKWSGTITFPIPAREYILTISIVRPTGFSVTTKSYNMKGELLP